MKKLFFAFAAIATLASCNNDQIIDFDKNPINFGEAFVDNSVRAEDPSYGTGKLVKEFQVWGTVAGNAGSMVLFNGARVYDTDPEYGVAYNCEQQEYWIPSATYNFVAIAHAASVTPATGMPETITYNADGVSDLLYTKTVKTVTTDTAATPSENPVEFSFSHLLSKVHFTVTSNAQGGYKHTVTGIKVANFGTGVYTINGGTWAGTSSKDFEFGSVEDVTSTSGALTSENQMLLIPNAATYNVTFTVDLYKGTTKLGTQTVTKAVENDLVAGHAYNFKIDCKIGAEIKFTVDENSNFDWTAVQPDITIQ